jgi:hypothetical protein
LDLVLPGFAWDLSAGRSPTLFLSDPVTEYGGLVGAPLPTSISYTSGNPSAVTTSAMTVWRQSPR